MEFSQRALGKQDLMMFRQRVMEEEWEYVMDKYNEDTIFHKIKIKGRGTALHMAVSSGQKDVVRRLVEAIVKFGDLNSLKIVDESGGTPLHLAAFRGFTAMCALLIGKEGERKELIQIKSDDGETPLFWAVRAHRIYVFAYLQQFYPQDIDIAINYNNTSILHIAIAREMFDLANIILYCNSDLGTIRDKDGRIPLEILATRTSAFKSGSRQLSWWKRILYHCLYISHQDAKTTMELFKKTATSEEKDDFSEGELSFSYCEGELEKPYEVPHTHAPLDFFSRVKILCDCIQKFVFRWPILSLLDLEAIKTIKKKHIFGSQILNKFMEDPYMSYMGDVEMKDAGEIVVQDTAYLLAANYGIVEMMLALKTNIRSVVYETNSNNENAMLLAVKNRQPHVIQWLQNNLHEDVFHHLYIEADNNANNVLHLAAYSSIQSENSWRISSATMQMMWDIKWYKYIKGLVPEHFNHISNKDGKIPSEIFEDQHKDLLQKSIEWLKETTQSSSVVATLIASVSFATSGSVPGENQQAGEPALERHLAFEGLAISSLIGLYFSVTSLIMFLSILSSRIEVEDFCRNLPMKLLFGLSSLFVSIVAMFVSFCAGHSFVLTDIYVKKGILFYLYISICLPVTLYAAVQFSLFVDLVNIIWKKVPPRSLKGVHL